MERERKAQELTVETIREEPWNAVYLPLPDALTGEVIEAAHFTIQYCYFDARARADDPEGKWVSAHEPKLSAYGSQGDASQHAEAALSRLLEIERRYLNYADRLLDAPYDIPNSVADLREGLKHRSQENESQQRSEAENPKDGSTRDDTSSEVDNGRSPKDTSNVEITDRVQRLLDAATDRDPDLEHDGPSQSDPFGEDHSRGR